MTPRKAGLTIAACLVLLFAAAMTGGEILRGEISPWFWEQYHVSAARHGQADALFGVGLYLAFYATGFVIPYSILSIAVWSWYAKKGFRNTKLINEAKIGAGVFMASFGCLMSFVLLLDAAMAFLRRLPMEVWNGWLVILVLGASLFLVLAGIKGIWEEVSKTTIWVSHSAEVFCRCPRCDHEWTFPAERLCTHNILLER